MIVVDLGTDSVSVTDLIVGFPTGWPPRPPSGYRSIRAYKTGTATTDFTVNAYLFSQLTSADTFTPLPNVPSGGERTNVVVSPTPWGSGPSNNSADPALNGAAATVSTPMIWCHGFIIRNTGGVGIEFSFDAVNVHGFVAAGTSRTYIDRMEAGIALRSVSGTATFKLEAW